MNPSQHARHLKYLSAPPCFTKSRCRVPGCHLSVLWRQKSVSFSFSSACIFQSFHCSLSIRRDRQNEINDPETDLAEFNHRLQTYISIFHIMWVRLQMTLRCFLKLNAQPPPSDSGLYTMGNEFLWISECSLESKLNLILAPLYWLCNNCLLIPYLL